MSESRAWSSCSMRWDEMPSLRQETVLHACSLLRPQGTSLLPPQGTAFPGPSQGMPLHPLVPLGSNLILLMTVGAGPVPAGSNLTLLLPTRRAWLSARNAQPREG